MANLIGDRIIVLIDMDCFFCQVESRLQPDLQGKPLAVVQYNQWRSGGIIAVNYEARDFGVTRHMRGDEAKEKCSDIVLVSVPSVRGKADTSKYRSAGREVIEVLKKHCTIIERASVDEAYLDITELVEKKVSSDVSSQEDLTNKLANTFVVGYCEDESNDEEERRNGVVKWLTEAYAELGDEQARRLAIAGTIVEELRSEIYAFSKFRCSAGISYNKILAKLACALHKPNRQTILPASAVPSLYSTLPVKKVRNLGGKFGNIVMESLGCNVMADLTRYSLRHLQNRFDEKTGSWLYNIARGIDNEPVVTRLVCKSIGASKNFPGKQAIVELDVLKHWTNELSLDVSDRLVVDLEENERRATTLTVSFSYYEDRKVTSQSRSCPLKSYKPERIASQCVEMLTKSTQKPIINISIAAGKFIPAKGSGNFVNFFKTTCPTSNSKDTTTRASTKRDDDNSLKTNDDESSLKSHTGNSEIRSNNGGEAERVGVSEKQKKSVESFFTKQTQNRQEDTVIGKPVSPCTAILGGEQLRKALNRDNLKNSFFMNFLKDAKPDINNSEQSSKMSSSSSSSSSSSKTEPKSAKPAVTSIQSPKKPKYSDETNQRVLEDERIEESHLLAQLQEIFPDLDNIDRAVVQLLPMELQRFANSYLRTKSDNRKVQTVKNVSKASKSKTVKSQGTPASNSLRDFFVKTTSTSTRDPLDFRKCSECDRMIKIEKYSEHADFHVAKNLQRDMHLVESNDNVTVESSTDSTCSKRRRSNESSGPNGKKPKTISSFFCTS